MKEFTSIPLTGEPQKLVMIGWRRIPAFSNTKLQAHFRNVSWGQWALNKFVARWTADIKQMKATGFPNPIVK